MSVAIQRLAQNKRAVQTLVIPPVTPLPADVLKRFPSLAEWHAQEESRRANFQVLLNRSLQALVQE